MSIAAKITIDTEVRSAGWNAGLAKNEKELRSFVSKAQGTFKNLTFQNGFGNFAGTLSAAAKGAEELATALRKGGSAQEALGKIVDGIPIVGPMRQAGEAIRELITGEKAAVELARDLGAASEANYQTMRRIALTAATIGADGRLLHGPAMSDAQARINAEDRAKGERALATEAQKRIAEIQAHESEFFHLQDTKDFTRPPIAIHTTKGGIDGTNANLSDPQKDLLRQARLDFKIHDDAARAAGELRSWSAFANKRPIKPHG